MKFDSTSPYYNAWQGSEAQEWCETLYNNSFSDGEQNAVLATTKSDKKFDSSSGLETEFECSQNILSEDKVFFLSTEEAENSAYGFTDDNARIAYYGDSVYLWWLRSSIVPKTDEDTTVSVGVVSTSDYLYGSQVSTTGAVRPAFNLNLNAVLFTSAAEGGKSSATMGTFSAVSDYSGSDWKLTLLDDSRNFTANVNGQMSTSAPAGGNVQITYSDAQTGDNEYVSVLLCDSNGNVLYYGNIAKNSANGTATLNIPSGLAAGNYTLKVFSEQCNGDKMTDYASAFQDISLTVTEYVAPSTGGGTVISKPTTSRISGYDRFETAVKVAKGSRSA